MKEKSIFKNDYIKLKKCKWGYFAFNRFDKYIGKSLDIYGEWCEEELDLLGPFINPKDTIIDVGANIGTHTVFFSKKALHGTVIAFEPQRLIFQILSANIALNCLENVYTYQAAVGNQKGTILVPAITPHLEFNFGALRLDQHKEGEKTNLMIIDDLNLKNLNLIKIDVEGMEKKVLQGASYTIKKFRPVIFIENNTTENSSVIIDTMYAMDYRCWWHITSYFNKENYFKEKTNVFSLSYPEANMLCLHKEALLPSIGLIEVDEKEDNWVKALERAFNLYNGNSLNFTEEEYRVMKF